MGLRFTDEQLAAHNKRINKDALKLADDINFRMYGPKKRKYTRRIKGVKPVVDTADLCPTFKGIERSNRRVKRLSDDEVQARFNDATNKACAAHNRRIKGGDANEPTRPRGAHAVAGAASAKTRKHTNYNVILKQQLDLAGTEYARAGYVCEYRFCIGRLWRIDFAWPHMKLAVEIDGQAHIIKERWEKSFEREQALFFSGWRLLKVHPKQVKSGVALQLIERALKLLMEDI